jgi:hypothetical protein
LGGLDVFGCALELLGGFRAVALVFGRLARLEQLLGLGLRVLSEGRASSERRARRERCEGPPEP